MPHNDRNSRGSDLGFPRYLMVPGRQQPLTIGAELNSAAAGLGGIPYQQGPEGARGAPFGILGGPPGRLAEGSARSLAQVLAAARRGFEERDLGFPPRSVHPRPRPIAPPSPIRPLPDPIITSPGPVRLRPKLPPFGGHRGQPLSDRAVKELEARTRFQPSSGQVGDGRRRLPVTRPEQEVTEPVRTPVNPNTFLKPGYTGDRDPLEHLRFWENQGWRFNEGTGRFRWVGSGAAPGSGGGGGGSDPVVPPPTPPPGDPGFGGLIPDALAMFQRQQLLNNLTGTLAMLQNQRPILEGSYNLGLQRLNTDRSRSEASKREELADRGIFGSGIQNRDLGIIRNLFERETQDLGFNQAEALARLESQIQQANAGYQASLAQVLESLAQRQLQANLAGVA